MSEVDFDVAVVGAGPAGSVTAALLARQGRSVVLIERGEQPGAKNLSGGVLYGRVLDQVFPGFAGAAPVERRITRNVVSFTTADSAVAMDAGARAWAEPVNAVTVLRARFDPWLAEQAEAAGAYLMPGVRVDELVTQEVAGKPTVVGVRAGEDVLRTHVVVAADGVNSFLARGLGLRAAPPPHHLALGVKAVVGLPAGVIEDRFGVAPGEGAAHAMVGAVTQGIGGGAFCYTNTESVSVGVVLRLDDLLASGLEATDVFEQMLGHPALDRYLRGGELREYGSHLVAEGGLAGVGAVATHGLVVVGDAAGLTINSGLTVRGMDLAIGSAVAAAGGIGEALDAHDVTAQGLAGYRRRLDAGFVGADLRTYARTPAFLERPRMYRGYPELLEKIMVDVFALDTTPRTSLASVARRAVRGSGLRLRDIASDAWAGVRAL